MVLLLVFICVLVTMTAQLMVTGTTSEEKVLRSKHHVMPVSASLALPAARKRRQLTPEELEQRRKKVTTHMIILDAHTVNTEY